MCHVSGVMVILAGEVSPLYRMAPRHFASPCLLRSTWMFLPSRLLLTRSPYMRACSPNACFATRWSCRICFASALVRCSSVVGNCHTSFHFQVQLELALRPDRSNVMAPEVDHRGTGRPFCVCHVRVNQSHALDAHGHNEFAACNWFCW